MSGLQPGMHGISPQQSVTNYRDSSTPMIRKILRNSWNNPFAAGNVNGYGRAMGEFRAINNLGDYLSRPNYVCNIPNPIQPNSVSWRNRITTVMNNCDTTGIPCSNTNVKFVPDSSDYITYKKQRAVSRTYDDYSFGGDDSHASYVPILGVRRMLG
jgi:hypothetical protein